MRIYLFIYLFFNAYLILLRVFFSVLIVLFAGYGVDRPARLSRVALTGISFREYPFHNEMRWIFFY